MFNPDKPYDFLSVIDMATMKVSIPRDCHFSIGTSPYYAHQHGLAIDVYQNLSLENYDVLSPISGVVIKTKTMKAPKPKFKGGTNKEYLILVSNKYSSKTVYKILHVKPKIQEGDKISIGDIIGTTIRNGYFANWSSPHLHLELKTFEDAYRAKGGKSFSLALESNKMKLFERNKDTTNLIPIEIKEIYPEFILAKFPEYMYNYIDPFYGVSGKCENIDCLIDGGIPIYKNGIVIFSHEPNLDIKESIYLNDSKIGELRGLHKNFGSVRFDQVVFLLNGKKIRGISLYLAGSLPLIKVIPFKINEFSFQTNSIQYLIINP
ncbi:MAG: M23 family metallopeptidase [Candidatus Hodarchaeota archaeon]